jgi:hypothetical protein
MRGRSWFEDEMLLPGERRVRRTPARMHSTLPPYRWHGELLLTTRRLFFLPDIDHPLLAHAAFWLEDVSDAVAYRGAVAAATSRGDVAFELPALLPRDHARSFASSLRTLARIARARTARSRFRRAG